MEKINLKNDIKVFGTEVKTFPNGVDDAFHELIKTIADDNEDARSYYGISEYKNGKMLYYATAEERQAGDAEKFNYKTLVIESGDYVAEKLDDWRTKTDCIKDVFQKIIDNGKADTTKPAIEWYKNDKEMLCMVKC